MALVCNDYKVHLIQPLQLPGEPLKMNYPTSIDPRQIIVRRETRQRQSNIADITDLVDSFRNTGQMINPIVVRQVGDTVVLVAGERRLRAALTVEWPTVDIRFIEGLNEADAEVLELEENIKRKELSWRDNTKAVGRLHAIFVQKDARWSVAQTAEAISLSRSYLNKILSVYEAIDSPRIVTSDSLDNAFNTLSKFAERRAADVVSAILAGGVAAFKQDTIPASQATSVYVSAPANGAFDITRPLAVFEEGPRHVASPQTEMEILSRVDGATEPPPAQEEILHVSRPTLFSALPTTPIICGNFLEWAPQYTGPKFSVIHCDFPYGNYKGDASSGSMAGLDTEEFYDNHESIYWDLVNGLISNLDRLMSYSAHLVFWFNMNFYTETVARFRQVGLMVHDHPFVWNKTAGGGGLGVLPGTATTYPRRTYDTALLAVRGNRPLAKPGLNSYSAPTVGNKIHPSQKPEPMLKHFLSMVVDETSSVLDPTCGSAAALRVCEDLGAKAILGLELDPNYAASALARTMQARVLRQAGAIVRKDQI